MKKTAKTIILSASALILVVLVVLSVISYVKINTKYPKAEVHRYVLGDTMEYEGYAITFKEAKMYKYWDFQKEYDYEDNEGIERYVDEEKFHVMVVTVDVTNLQDETVAFPYVTYFNIQTESGYSSCADIQMMYSFYDYEMSIITDEMEPHETRTITMLYSMAANRLDVYDGDVLDIKDFDIVVSLYPQKNYYDLAG